MKKAGTDGMKLRVLVDNNTYIDRYYLGEPAVSYYIECDGIRLLFDAGYSDVFLKNAEALGIDLGLVTHLVFSHGHNDHTRGLKFMKERLELSGMEVIAHPSCFDEKVFGEESIGAPYSAADMAGICRYRPCGGPCNISERLVFLGEIPDAVDFETRKAIGRTRIRGKWQDDYVRDDSALVYRGGGRHFYYNRVFPQRYMQYSAIRPSGMRTAAGSRHHRGIPSL